MTTAAAAPTTLAANRDAPHYSGSVPKDKDLTDAQRVAVEEVRATVDDITRAEAELQRALNARVRAVKKHATVLKELGWRPAARAIGNITDSTLRADSTRETNERG